MSFENTYVEMSPRDEALADDGRTPLALAAGLIAALVAGGIWAGLVFATNMEIGYVAWGVGLLVGLAMSRVTSQRSRQLAVAAAAFAVLGLIAGKAFIFAGSAGVYAKDLEKDHESMSAAVAWQMYESRELDPGTLGKIDAIAYGAQVPYDVWTAMRAEGTARLATMSAEEKHAVAVTMSKQITADIGMMGGILAQVSLFDLLWLFLAVGTAFRMMAPPREEPAGMV
jgi:hypothetical protein